MTSLTKRFFHFVLPAFIMALQALLPVHAEALSAKDEKAVQAVVQQAAAPLTVAQVAARFRRTRPERVRPLLDTLAALSLVRATPEGAFGA